MVLVLGGGVEAGDLLGPCGNKLLFLSVGLLAAVEEDPI